MTALWILIASFAGALVFASFFEWTLHKYVMHGVLLKGYAYDAHDQVHHKVFDADHHYHLQDTEKAHIVTMAWWNGPVLILLNAPAPLLVAWLTGSWWVLPGAMIGFVSYYCAYEYLHWCMHVPRGRWFQRTRVFRWIDRHHRIHHLEPMRNLNVVLPIADFLMRTRRAVAPA